MILTTRFLESETDSLRDVMSLRTNRLFVYVILQGEAQGHKFQYTQIFLSIFQCFGLKYFQYFSIFVFLILRSSSE